jgi:hypothetical protein
MQHANMSKIRMDRKSDGSVYKMTDKEQKRQLHNAICCWIANSLSALPLTLPPRSIRRALPGCRALTCTRHFITRCYRNGINPTTVLLSHETSFFGLHFLFLERSHKQHAGQMGIGWHEPLLVTTLRQTDQLTQ